MFTRTTSRLLGYTARSALTTFAPSRFSSTRVLKSNKLLQAGFLGLIGVGIAGYSQFSIRSDEFYEVTIPANLSEG